MNALARAEAGYDEDHEQALLDAIIDAIAEASLISEPAVLCLRTGEIATALTRALTLILAISPSAVRHPQAHRGDTPPPHQGGRRCGERSHGQPISSRELSAMMTTSGGGTLDPARRRGAQARRQGHARLSLQRAQQIAVERNKEGIITATVEHMKDAEAGAVMASKLERVELGTDADDDPLSSCVIVPADDVVYPAEKQDTKKKALLRATLVVEEAKLIELFREYVWVRDKRDKRDKSRN